jgi:phenylacetate-coenzyme A ligase PaaK-like adenylate-forming protein
MFMSTSAPPCLELPWGSLPDPDEFIQAAMEWHFSPETGSRFWLERAKSLNFDPRRDVKSFADLMLFPNVTDELRNVRVEDLIPQGYGPQPDIVGIIESGGTTGDPKRLPLLADFAERMRDCAVATCERDGVPHDKHWLILTPSGPHGALAQAKRAARSYGVAAFAVDMDPRWVKKQISSGNRKEADAYAEHILDQAQAVLRAQNVGYLRITPPLLAMAVRRDAMVDLIREKITHISWGGASMDEDTRYQYRTEIFPGIALIGGYGTTMCLGGGAHERAGLSVEDSCVFDPELSPYVTINVTDASTNAPVPYGERGQLVVHHVSKSFLLPGNFERDTAIRAVPAAEGQVGDSVAEIAPVAEFGGVEVIEGVY